MFFDGSHLIPIKVDDHQFAVTAATQNRVVNLREKLPAMLRGDVGHCVGFMVEDIVTPTFTTAPTLVQLANALTRLTVKAENARVAIDVAGADLRAMESYENRGLQMSPDSPTNQGSTHGFYARRFALFAPPNYRGSPKDFAIPNVLLNAGAIEQIQSVLTAISADTTAATVRRIVTALCVSLDKVRIGPKTDLKFWTAAGSALELGERCLLSSLMLMKSSAHASMAAGDYGTFTLSDRKGSIFVAQDAANLTAQYHTSMGTGQFSIIQGEPRDATYDVNTRVVNSGTPTALAAAAPAYQPIAWAPPGSSIANIEAEGPFKLEWTGSTGTAYVAGRRILPRSQQEAYELAVQVFTALGLPYKGASIRGHSSAKPYVGPRAEYMPWDFNYR